MFSVVSQEKYIYTMYIYSKRHVLHNWAIYPPAILRLWYGYPTVRVGRWLVSGRDRVGVSGLVG